MKRNILLSTTFVLISIGLTLTIPTEVLGGLEVAFTISYTDTSVSEATMTLNDSLFTTKIIVDSSAAKDALRIDLRNIEKVQDLSEVVRNESNRYEFNVVNNVPITYLRNVSNGKIKNREYKVFFKEPFPLLITPGVLYNATEGFGGEGRFYLDLSLIPKLLVIKEVPLLNKIPLLNKGETYGLGNLTFIGKEIKTVELKESVSIKKDLQIGFGGYFRFPLTKDYGIGPIYYIGYNVKNFSIIFPDSTEPMNDALFRKQFGIRVSFSSYNPNFYFDWFEYTWFENPGHRDEEEWLIPGYVIRFSLPLWRNKVIIVGELTGFKYNYKGQEFSDACYITLTTRISVKKIVDAFGSILGSGG